MQLARELVRIGDDGYWMLHDAHRSIRTVAFYDRASTRQQAKNGSRDAGRYEATRVCQAHGWTLRRDRGEPTFLDVVSGVEAWPRPALARAILEPTVDAIAVLYSDRLAREPHAMASLIDWCAAWRKNVLCFDVDSLKSAMRIALLP